MFVDADVAVDAVTSEEAPDQLRADHHVPLDVSGQTGGHSQVCLGIAAFGLDGEPCAGHARACRLLNLKDFIPCANGRCLQLAVGYSDMRPCVSFWTTETRKFYR